MTIRLYEALEDVFRPAPPEEVERRKTEYYRKKINELSAALKEHMKNNEFFQHNEIGNFVHNNPDLLSILELYTEAKKLEKEYKAYRRLRLPGIRKKFSALLAKLAYECFGDRPFLAGQLRRVVTTPTSNQDLYTLSSEVIDVYKRELFPGVRWDVWDFPNRVTSALQLAVKEGYLTYTEGVRKYYQVTKKL